MKFLQDPVEQKTVEFLSEIQSLFTNLVQGLADVKSKSMQKLLEKISSVPEMSLTEFESFLAGNEQGIISVIVKNGTKKHSFLEENYNFKKNKAVPIINIDVNKALYGLIPTIANGNKPINNEKYNELISIYMDAANLNAANKIKSNIVVAITEYVLKSIYYVYGYTHESSYKELLNRFAGLIILSKNEQLLNNFNKVFDKSYHIPSLEQGEKPSDIFKVLKAKVLINDEFHDTNSLNFKEVTFASWEDEFKGKNVATKYLPHMDNYYLLKCNKYVYLVEKKSKLIPLNLKSYSYLKEELYDKRNLEIAYHKLLNRVMKSILIKPELFEQYSFYEIKNSIGMFETMSISETGVMKISVFEMGIESDEVYFKHLTYDCDVSEISSFKPATDLKINLFMTYCEVATRRSADWEIRDQMRKF